MRLAVLLICAAIIGSIAAPVTAASGETAFAFSADPAISAEQHAAYAVVHQYEHYLNAGSTEGILGLFAPQSVAEWNDKPTFATRAQKQAGYDALFKIAKFSTVFDYASTTSMAIWPSSAPFTTRVPRYWRMVSRCRTTIVRCSSCAS